MQKESKFSFATGDANFYEHYYSSQAMINHGGDAWNAYNNLVRDELLKNQKKDGSWPAQKFTGSKADPIYFTALGTLMLEVYYRFLPGTGTAQ